MTDTSDKAKSQKAAILAHLRQHGSIDSKTSRTLFGCEALRSRIADLRKAGVEIETRHVRFVSRFGHPGRYAEYHFSQSKTMQKVTKMPIGLGMNHLEQEIAACHLWNAHYENGNKPDEWAEIQDWCFTPMFDENGESRKSLESEGFIEMEREKGRFRLTPKAIELFKEFTENQ